MIQIVQKIYIKFKLPFPSYPKLITHITLSYCLTGYFSGKISGAYLILASLLLIIYSGKVLKLKSICSGILMALSPHSYLDVFSLYLHLNSIWDNVSPILYYPRLYLPMMGQMGYPKNGFRNDYDLSSS